MPLPPNHPTSSWAGTHNPPPQPLCSRSCQDSTHLLVVLDSHAERVDENGHHDPTAKIFAVHNLPEGLTHHVPEGQHQVGSPGLGSAPLWVPLVTVVGILCELIDPLAVRVSRLVVRQLSLACQRCQAVGAALRGAGATFQLGAGAGDLAGALAGT